MSAAAAKVSKRPTMPSLSNRFASLKETKVSYVCLFGCSTLPQSTPADGMMLFLTSQLSSMVNLLRLTGNRGEGRYRLPISDKESREIYVAEKGNNLFPDRYESMLLGPSAVYKNDVRVPENSSHASSILYWKLFREGWLIDQPEQRRILCEYVETIVGPMVAADYGWVTNFRR